MDIKRPLLLIAVALILGELIIDISGISIRGLLIFSAILTGMAIFIFVIWNTILNQCCGKFSGTGNWKRLRKMSGVYFLILGSGLLGACRFGTICKMLQTMQDFCTEGTEYEIYGYIAGIDMKPESEKVYIQLGDVSISDADRLIEIEGKILVVLDQPLTQIKMGRYMQLKATCGEWKEASNEGGFDLSAYYNSMGIYGIFYSEPEKIQWMKKDYSLLCNNLIDFRQKMTENLHKITGEKEASVLAGILLGDKSEIDSETKELYQFAGISHLLAISGLHISIIGMGIFKILRHRFRVTVSGIAASVLVWSFGFMSGNGISVRRAMAMFFLGILAEITGRTYDMLSALSLAAVLILLEMPLALQSPTLQLSFGALLGIVLVAGRVKQFIKVKSKIGKTILTSECINLVTRPVIALNYYQIPVFSTVVNLIVIPLFGIVLCIGMTGLALSLFCIPLARYIILIPVYILKFYELLCRGYEKIPAAVGMTGKPSAETIYIYYGILFLMLCVIWCWEQKRKNEENAEEFWYIRYGKKASILIIFFLLNGIILKGHRREDCIKMLDVGQGDCIYIGTEEGQDILVDAGSSSNSDLTEYVILPFLKANGVKRISYLIMTHSDNDHMNGMTDLLNIRYQNHSYVDCLVVPDIPEKLRDENYLQLIETAEENGVGILYMSAGMKIVGKNMEISCIYPTDDVSLEDKNQLSLNFIIQIRGIRAMFTGDIEAEGEKYLIQTQRLSSCEILKVAHHGSNSSTTKEYASQVHPYVSLISCSADNGYGHPGEDTLGRLKEVGSDIYITKDCGQITIHIRKNGFYSVERFKG